MPPLIFERMDCPAIAISWVGIRMKNWPAKSFETFIPAVILLLVVSLLQFANAAEPVPILSPGDHTITLS
jgi:hypothetical protein